MIPGLVQEAWDAFLSKITGAFSWVSDYFYLGEWYALGVAFLFGCLTLARFFGALPVIGKWIRAMGGGVVLLYVAFLAGMTIMFKHDRRKDDE